MAGTRGTGRTGADGAAPHRTPEEAAGPAEPAGRAHADVNVPPDVFRRVLGAHAAGVVVVTADPAEGPVGLTATSFTSVSLDPPLVSFYIDARSGSWPGVRDSRTFAVNLLHEHQRDVAARFAARGVDRFAAPTRWFRGPGGVPLLHGAVGHVRCLRHDVLAVGDHWLVVGRVVGAETGDDGRPLLYHRSRYGRFEA
ncbi:flavin reductase family protein [Marinitenerispora sediminis]|uniref:Flavin reductase n=1 Tax=Marinitenerispora sediminis TaxID=1931232 RepID=A0A368T586_9ACTN|nr:flavin reductase family protein [Marinitenerispora sediminis]RCV57440.1 flavin reductase [Marinitenerispora sediminis]RCV58799.1 flavin reductase [Marinitenerispora sediminis]RCV61282.1 flavin reductase [Marinitenerispora sediminis]